MNPELLRLAARLADRAARAESAAALAAALHAEDLVVFVRDAEVDALLPAPGFPRTLQDARAWRGFLAASVEHGCHRGEVRLVATSPRPAVGVGAGADVVGVLVGGSPSSDDLAALALLLPLLSAGFRAEQAAEAAQANARIARGSAAQERALAAALERVRGELQSALQDARVARRKLEDANELLQRQAGELSAANALLQDRTLELELQAEVLQEQAAELEVANEALESARAEAEEANRAKAEFLATMSHELRTPLNAIGGYVQIMEMGIHGPLTAEQRDDLGRINRSQRHLLGIINDILNYARIEAGHVEYRITPVPVADALANIDALIAPLVAARGHTYEVRIPERDLVVLADREKMEQILLNLLSNAVKFTEPAGHIGVEARCGQAGTSIVDIRVTDTGGGIPHDKLDVIFDPFVQVDGSHSRERQGTGLGLAISRDLARGMRGELCVRSTVGAGSTFTLTLPAGANDARTPRSA